MWSPSPAPEETVPPGLGWSGEGPAAEPLDPVTGWWIKKQALGQVVSYAEFTARLKAYLAAVAAGQAVISASSIVHLVGIARSSGGFEGGTEVADALVKAYLTAWSNSVGTASARAVFAAGGTYVGIGSTAAEIRAKLTALAAGALVSSAQSLAHLFGQAVGIGTPGATADFSAQGPATTTYTAASGSFTYAIPPWSKVLVVVLLGGGASGQTGNGGVNTSGAGGNPGAWNWVLLTRGTDIPWSASSISLTVGAATGRAANSNNAAPVNGNATSATISGVGTLVANGGVGTKTVQGTNWQVGAPAGNLTADGDTYVGGAESNSTQRVGYPPGGGGSGGAGGIFGNRTQGWEGARGGAWVKARQ